MTVTGRVTVDPRIFEVSGSSGRTVMITLAAHRIVAEGQAIEQSVRVVVMASGSASSPAAKVAVGQQIQVQGLLTPPREGRAEAGVLKLRPRRGSLHHRGPLTVGLIVFVPAWSALLRDVQRINGLSYLRSL